MSHDSEKFFPPEVVQAIWDAGAKREYIVHPAGENGGVTTVFFRAKKCRDEGRMDIRYCLDAVMIMKRGDKFDCRIRNPELCGMGVTFTAEGADDLCAKVDENRDALCDAFMELAKIGKRIEGA